MPSTRRSLLQASFTSFIADPGCVPDDPAPIPSLEEHVANRLGFGPRPGEVASIAGQGVDAWIAEQLDPASINDASAAANWAFLEKDTLSMSNAQLYDLRSDPRSSDPFYQVRHHTLARMIWSKRQLFERVVNFWHDHFSIYGRDFITRSLFPTWDKLIRDNALGNFRVMLEATAKNPCMLYYLDNYLNTNAGPNENYARECFELHTMGSENYRTYQRTDPEYDPADHYIDADVYGAADCLTGWTYERDSEEPGRGSFVYRDEDHNRGFKIVLGEVFDPDGPPEDDGQRVLDLLVNHPGTARYIAWKLCRRFVADDPPESLITSTAAVFSAQVDAPDQIKQVLEHIFASSEFRDPQYRMNKIKRPIDWVISAHRALDIPYTAQSAFFWIYDPIGQPIFEWRPPDGPPEELSEWANSNGLLRRWNMIYRISSNWYDDEGIDFNALAATPQGLETARELANYWLTRVHSRAVSPSTEAATIEFIADGRGWDQPLSASHIENRVKHLAALCTMSPEFQRK